MIVIALRYSLLALATLTFAWFARQDMRFHLTGRKLSNAEHALHAALGISQSLLIIAAFVGARAWCVGGALATAALGAGDEYLFHRGIPGAESELHAKAHFALFIFVAIALALPLGATLAH